MSDKTSIEFLNEVKNIFNLSKVRKSLQLGTELFGAIQPFIEKPTIFNAFRATIQAGKVLIDDVEVWSDSFFDGDEWSMPFSRDFGATIVDAVHKFPFEVIRTTDESSSVRLANVNGVKVGWIFSTKSTDVSFAPKCVYVETEHLNDARATIKHLLWEKYGARSLVMRKNTLQASDRESTVVFEADDDFDSKPSRRAKEYSDYLKKCMDAGVPRSVLFYGPPGTGKSTLARTIVEILGMKSFRIRIEDMDRLDSASLFEAIDIFQPEAVILDDFDRTRNQAAMLETLEFFQQRVKLVIATANNKDNLDEALLRPERLDEIMYVEKMDEEVVKRLLGEKGLSAFEAVKDWPIAFINEYMKRCKFLEEAEALSSVQELANRVKRLKKYKDNDRLENIVVATKNAGNDEDDDDENPF